MKIIDGGITAPKGFLANGIAAGIKKRKKDIAILVSEIPAQAAGAFTTNKVKAAPVIWDKQLIDSGKTMSAIVINSGNANACTGEKGFSDTRDTASYAAELLAARGIDTSAEQVLVCSTGVIGVPLPMDTVKEGIKTCVSGLSKELEAAKSAADAICTTDTFRKEIAVEIEIDGKPIRIAGMAKGSGMIHPNMATMLSFITTDAELPASILQKLLGTTIIDTYNMISVDGDTSTNDTVLVLANGCSGVNIQKGTLQWEEFCKAFTYVHTFLAKAIVRDGEGAGKFIEVIVNGAKSIEDARILARSVVASSLVKAAFFGADANWGRILCAMGYSGADFNPAGTELSFSSSQGSIIVVKNGEPVAFNEDFAKKILLEKEVTVTAKLNDGESSAKAWGCDLSYEYVRINGDYRS
ncbi:MAG: bifunctional ornithine acetyltransferase/N-acetylglutamate synthase [Treponema sp.]